MITLSPLILGVFLAFSAPEKVPQINMSEYEKQFIRQDNDTLYVVNFWATWCKPCVAEIPYFEAAGSVFSNQKVSIHLISLDFTSERTSVLRMLQEKGWKLPVAQLQAGSPNSWINRIDSTWSGAIPATVMYRQGRKCYFKEGEFEQQELIDLIKSKIQ